jgi:hypothetical protein
MADMRGDGTVFRQKGSRFWWISYWRDGKRRRESSGSEEFKVARDLLNLRRAGAIVRAGEVPASTPETVTIAELVSDLLAWYLTENPRPVFHKDTLSRWELHLQPFFGDTKASELGSSHLRAYRVKRTAEKAAFATINRELQILRKAYKLAAESEPPKVLRVPKFKAAIGRERNARKVFIDPATTQKLKDAAAKEGLWARAFLEMAFTLGWRKGEIQKLMVGNIWLSEGTVRIEDSKNGEAREISMPDSLRVLVQPLVIGRNPQESLWPVTTFRYAWKRICKAAGVKTGKLEGFVLHDIRRTSARSKRASGVSESVIMDIHGWKTSEMFRRYGIVNQADRVQALLKESEFLAEAQKKSVQTEQKAIAADLPYVSRTKTGNA